MKKILFLGLGLVLAMGFTACKDDILIGGGEENQEVLDKDQTFYLGLNLMEVSEKTRSGQLGDYGSESYDPTQDPNFDSGQSYENAVNSIFLVFYDAAENRISATGDILENLTQNTTGLPASQNAIYAGVVEVEAKHGMGLPAYVMAIVNPITSTDFSVSDEFATLTNLEKAKRQYVVWDVNNKGTEYFAMSKSAYYGVNPNNTDEATKDDMVRIIATPITGQMLCNTRSEAEEALKGTSAIDGESKVPINIYVERYAAKVSFEFAENALTGDKNGKKIKLYDFAANRDEGDEYTLVFEPQYWAVNAYESETYLTKSFFEEDENTGKVNESAYASYTYMNNAIGGTNGWSGWNSADLHRCYWAQTPSYYASNYPRVSDDILDKRANGDTTSMGGYTSGYYSYYDMAKNAADIKLSSKARLLTSGKSDTKYKSPAIYVRENTVSGNALRRAYNDPDASPKAAIASVVVVGHYKIRKTSGGEIKFDRKDDAFYVIGSTDDDYRLFTSTNDMLRYYYEKIDLILSSSNSEHISIFEANGTNGLKLRSEYEGLFELKHPEADVRGDYVLDSRFVTLQFKKDWNTTDYPVYIQVQSSWIPANDARANWNLMSAAGITRQFTNGLAYFNIPINHLGFYRAGNPNRNLSPTSKDFKWNEVKSGDFGLVRNHSYRIEATQVLGLGNAIPDPSTPIVPPTDPDAYYLGLRVVVLNWALVPKQSVEL